MHRRSRSLPVADLAVLSSAFGVGGLIAVQSHANGRLAVELGGGLDGAAVAALTSFGSGLVIVSLLCAAARPARHGLARVLRALRGGQLRPWHAAGGLAGALLVSSQGLTVGTIGVALFTVAVVAGQTTSAIVVDRVGLGPAGRRGVTPGRVLGAGLAVAAVGLTVAERMSGPAALVGPALLLAALPLVAGAGAAAQQAVVGRVSVVGGPLPAAWVNFVVGTALLTGLVSVLLAVGDGVLTPPATWWLYIGGALGVCFISSASVLVQRLGVLVFGLCAISGQVVTALVVDLLLSDIDVGPLTVSGTLLTLVGIAAASMPGVRTRTVTTPAEREPTRDVPPPSRLP